ncbi:AAA family ATPase [Desulfosarcina sp.]|uniref:AAA family ATPase n=1 Tax=Desulfosarcina sp. TaxID=2027861 RepID=UPI00397046E7
MLKYGILDNKGFLLLTGDVGTGKTTLLNALTDSLGDDVLVAMVADPGLAKMDFFNFVADSFGMNRSFRSKGDFLIYLKNYLLQLNQQNKQALLIIDECQHLTQKMLEEVRLLSNIEKSSTKLINIFFVGQSEFNNIILRPQNRAIRQRITINYNISSLSEAETSQYIRFRLAVAGSDNSIFTSAAIQAIYQFSHGYPRLINIICDQALLTGFVREKSHVDEKIVLECADELKIKPQASIEASDATPEARTENITAQAPQAIPALTGWWQNQSMKTPLLVALVVVMIIWIGLLGTFIFNRQPLNATSSSADKTASPETEPEREVAQKTPSLAADRQTGDEGATGSGKQPPSREGDPGTQESAGNKAQAAAPDSQEAADSTAKQAAAGGAQTDQRGSAAPSAPVPQRLQVPISLSDIRETYGLYPEVYFGFNSNNLDDAAYELLDKISGFCLQHPETIIILRGYTDKSGVRNYNLKLSEFRADMVKTYLVGKGVNVDTITTIAVGPDEEGPGGTKVPYDGQRRKVIIEIITPSA